MNIITFQCMACDGDFDLQMTHLAERPNALKCPHCGNKPRTQRAHAFAQALDDMLTAMAGLRSTVTFEINLSSDELPPPYGSAEPEEESGLTALTSRNTDGDDDDDDDFEEDDEFDDDDDEDLDDDDDDDFDDDDEDLEEDDEEEDRY